MKDSEVEAHLDQLREVGDDLAAAKAEADFLTDMLKTIHAAQYLKSVAPRAADKEAEAYASPAYQKALDDRATALMRAEKLRHKKAWHERVIEVWQTMSANTRGRI